MEELVFVLPTFIIFFIILFQIFSLFKRAFDFIRKRFDLTIDQAGDEIESKSGTMNTDFNQDEVENRIAEAEKESFAESKERILNQNSESQTNKVDSKRKNMKDIKKNGLKQAEIKKQKSTLGDIFDQYNEVEKAVIYNEILSKPKALKKD